MKGKKIKPVSYESVDKREKHLEVFLFEVSLESPERKKKLVFQVYGVNYLRSLARLERWIIKNKKYKKYKIIDTANISQKDVEDREIIAINTAGKPKRVKNERIDLERLQTIDHKKFGELHFANPKIVVSRDIVGEKILFWAPFDKTRMELKSLIFDPKYFNINLDLEQQILRGTQAGRVQKINEIRERLLILEGLSCRAIDLDFEKLSEELNTQIKSARKQFNKFTEINANLIAERIIRLSEKRSVKMQVGTKKYLSLKDCIRRVWRSSPEYIWEDLQLALKILKEKGYDVPVVYLAA